MLNWLHRLVGYLVTTIIGRGILLWLAARDIYPDRWVTKAIGIAESSPAAPWLLAGFFGLLGLAFGPSIAAWGSRKWKAWFLEKDQDMKRRTSRSAFSVTNSSGVNQANVVGSPGANVTIHSAPAGRLSRVQCEALAELIARAHSALEELVATGCDSEPVRNNATAIQKEIYQWLASNISKAVAESFKGAAPIHSMISGMSYEHGGHYQHMRGRLNNLQEIAVRLCN